MRLSPPTEPSPRLIRSPRPRVVGRLVLGIWLLVHVFVVGAAPVADALAGHGAEVVAHWEDAQDTSCPPQHDPATCQVCQSLQSTGQLTRPERVAMVATLDGSVVRGRTDGLAAKDTDRLGLPDSRGPPTA